MSRQDLFKRILAALHASALGDTPWTAASKAIDEFCGTKGNHLVYGEGTAVDGIDIFFAEFCFRGERDEEMERLYFGTYHPMDERLPRIRTLPDSKLVHVQSLFSDEEKKSSATYNEALVFGEARDGLNVRLDGPAGSRIVWTLSDPVDLDGWTTERRAAVESVLPQLRQFVRVRHALTGARALGASLTELLDNIRIGVIQLDRSGRVAAANDRARALLGEGDGLQVAVGHLHALLPGDDAALQRLIAQALSVLGGTGAGGSMLVTRGRHVGRLVLHISPVRDHSTIGALVLAVDPSERIELDVEYVGEALGLTRAESRVAVAITQGKRIEDIAAETGRARATVKWHIREIYLKLGLTRQMELAELVRSVAEEPRLPD